MKITNTEQTSLYQPDNIKKANKDEGSQKDIVFLGQSHETPDFLLSSKKLMEQSLANLGTTSSIEENFFAKGTDEKPSGDGILPKVNVTLNENGEPKLVAKQGMNAPVFCTTEKGNVGVFKPFVVNDDPKVAEMKRKETVYEIAASHIMDKFGIPTITYSEAKGDIRGVERKGVVSDFIKNKSLAEDPTMLKNIKNPDVAVRGMIFDAWMGNFDRILNNSNVWVKPDGNVIFGDYGCGFRKGTTAFGVPKANLAFMNLYAKKDTVEKALSEITSMSNEDVAKIVDDSLKFTNMEDNKLRDYMVGVLISNRDELKETNPFKPFYEKEPVAIEFNQKATEAFAQAMIDRYGFDKNNPSDTVDKTLKDTFFFNDPNAREVSDKLVPAIKKMMDSHVKGEPCEIKIEPEPPEVFNGVVNLIYNILSPQKCLELNLGLYF